MNGKGHNNPVGDDCAESSIKGSPRQKKSYSDWKTILIVSGL